MGFDGLELGVGTQRWCLNRSQTVSGHAGVEFDSPELCLGMLGGSSTVPNCVWA